MIDRSRASEVKNSSENVRENESEIRTFTRQKRPVFLQFLRAATHSMVWGSSVACFTQSLAHGGRGLTQNHFKSTKFASGTLNYFACFDGFLAWKFTFEALF